MNNIKEEKGVITTLANKIKAIDSDDTKKAMLAVNELENKLKQVKLKKDDKNNMKNKDDNKTKINSFELVKEAKEFMECNVMERE